MVLFDDILDEAMVGLTEDGLDQVQVFRHLDVLDSVEVGIDPMSCPCADLILQIGQRCLSCIR